MRLIEKNIRISKIWYYMRSIAEKAHYLDNLKTYSQHISSLNRKWAKLLRHLAQQKGQICLYSLPTTPSWRASPCKSCEVCRSRHVITAAVPLCCNCCHTCSKSLFSPSLSPIPSWRLYSEQKGEFHCLSSIPIRIRLTGQVCIHAHTHMHTRNLTRVRQQSLNSNLLTVLYIQKG